ncbi:hypothetical protein BE20_22990 [Sorangium cellulosum]|nr:hypothetical protein BE20_22990 [Sorangium cellulosum]
MARGTSDPRSAGARRSPRGGPRCAWLVLLSLVAAAPLAPPLAHAAVDRDAGAAAPASSALPELPRLAPIARPEPDITAVRELDRVLDQITSQDARARENARAALDEPISGVVDAVRLRVQDIRGSIDRDAAPRVLAEARREGRKALKGDKGGDDAPDGKKKGAEAKDDKGAKKGGDAKKGAGDAKKDAKDDKGAKKGARREGRRRGRLAGLHARHAAAARQRVARRREAARDGADARR